MLYNNNTRSPPLDFFGVVKNTKKELVGKTQTLVTLKQTVFIIATVLRLLG
jgi:hypothetical protein